MSPLEREAYQNHLERCYPKGAVLYTLANMALSEARSMVMDAKEPSEEMLDSISYRLQSASVANEEGNLLRSKRALMLGAFVRPLIWMDPINLEGLSDRESRRVSERLGLTEANNSLATTARESLREITSITKGKTMTDLTAEQMVSYGELRGFLQEATVVLLGNRTNTAKMVVMPTLEYEDALYPTRANRADGILYDNRNVTTAQRQYLYQVKSNESDDRKDAKYSVPVISANTLGNNKSTAGWSRNNNYSTLRYLLQEREGTVLSSSTSSNLDKIWGKVRNSIMGTAKRQLIIPKPSQIILQKGA